MRSTFKILFYANKGKEKDGIVPIMGRITINGTQCQFSCKHSISLAMWDVKGNCAKGRSKEAMQINRDLDNIKAQIIKHYQHLSDREAFVTAEMVRNSYQGFGSEYETLLNAFDKDIASLKKRVGKDRVASTLWAMQRSRKDVADFLQYNLRRTDISMLELAPEFIKDFAAYLSTDRGLANGTIWQRCIRDLPCRRYRLTALQVLARIRESPQSEWCGSGISHETEWQQRPERLTRYALRERRLYLQGIPNQKRSVLCGHLVKTEC